MSLHTPACLFLGDSRRGRWQANRRTPRIHGQCPKALSLHECEWTRSHGLHRNIRPEAKGEGQLRGVAVQVLADSQPNIVDEDHCCHSDENRIRSPHKTLWSPEMIAAAEIDLVYVFTDGDMPLTTWKALGNAPGANSAVIRCGQASRLRGYWRMTDNTEFSWPEAVPPDPRSAKFTYCRPTVRNPRKTGDNISTFSPPKRRKILQAQAFFPGRAPKDLWPRNAQRRATSLKACAAKPDCGRSAEPSGIDSLRRNTLLR
jgi:hypothetical protein